MRAYTLQCEMLAPQSISEVFEVFEDPANLARITPPWLNFQIVSPQPVAMRKGATIEYTIRWLGVPVHWKTRITEYEPPFYFVDEQEQGPYVLWRHRHTFRPGTNGTLVVDQVEYILPLGPLGRLAHRLLIGKQLREIFEYRQEAMKQWFGESSLLVQQPTIIG